MRAPYVKAVIIIAPNLCFAKNPNTLCFARNAFILLAFLATIAFDDPTSEDNALPAVLAATADAAPFATLLIPKYWNNGPKKDSPVSLSFGKIIGGELSEPPSLTLITTV